MNIIAFSMIVRIQNSITQVKVTGFTIFNWKFLLQHPKDQSVDQRNHLHRQYLDIALVPRQHLDITLVPKQYLDIALV